MDMLANVKEFDSTRHFLKDKKAQYCFRFCFFTDCLISTVALEKDIYLWQKPISNACPVSYPSHEDNHIHFAAARTQ